MSSRRQFAASDKHLPSTRQQRRRRRSPAAAGAEQSLSLSAPFPFDLLRPRPRVSSVSIPGSSPSSRSTLPSDSEPECALDYSYSQSPSTSRRVLLQSPHQSFATIMPYRNRHHSMSVIHEPSSQFMNTRPRMDMDPTMYYPVQQPPSQYDTKQFSDMAGLDQRGGGGAINEYAHGQHGPVVSMRQATNTTLLPDATATVKSEWTGGESWHAMHTPQQTSMGSQEQGWGVSPNPMTHHVRHDPTSNRGDFYHSVPANDASSSQANGGGADSTFPSLYPLSVTMQQSPEKQSPYNMFANHPTPPHHSYGPTMTPNDHTFPTTGGLVSNGGTPSTVSTAGSNQPEHMNQQQQQQQWSSGAMHPSASFENESISSSDQDWQAPPNPQQQQHVNYRHLTMSAMAPDNPSHGVEPMTLQPTFHPQSHVLGHPQPIQPYGVPPPMGMSGGSAPPRQLGPHHDQPQGSSSHVASGSRVSSANSNGNGGPLQQEVKRTSATGRKLVTKKAAKACLSCQKGHLTCDDQRPCTRCVKKGMGDQCCEGQRKKAKYLMTEEELGESSLVLESVQEAKAPFLVRICSRA